MIKIEITDKELTIKSFFFGSLLAYQSMYVKPNRKISIFLSINLSQYYDIYN